MDSLHWLHCLALHALNHREYFALFVNNVQNVQGPYCTYYIAQCTSYDKQFHCTCCTAIIISCCTEIDSLHRVGSAANACIHCLHQITESILHSLCKPFHCTTSSRSWRMRPVFCAVHLCRDQCIAHSAHEAHPPTGGIVVSSQRAPSEGNLSGIKDWYCHYLQRCHHRATNRLC